LQNYPQIVITIEGHADERGTREYNLALGERRADTVRNYLAALGVSPDRITVISYGKERPECPEAAEGCWSQNRRGVTVASQ
jgi:peptidoglycan-associated lipoprotein